MGAQRADCLRKPAGRAICISRVTLRQALADLEKDGIIKRYRGKGAFVNENPNQFIHELKYSLVTGNYQSDKNQVIKADILELKKFTNPDKPVCHLISSHGDIQTIAADCITLFNHQCFNRISHFRNCCWWFFRIKSYCLKLLAIIR